MFFLAQYTCIQWQMHAPCIINVHASLELNFLPVCCMQVLSKNRWTVLYCTLLAKAESDVERERIEEEMSADPDKNTILKVSLGTLM